MRGVILILLSSFAQAHAKEVAKSHAHKMQDSMNDLVDKVDDKLLGRALKTWLLHEAALDTTTVAKTNPDKNIGVLHNRLQLAPARTPLSVLHSTFPSLYDSASPLHIPSLQSIAHARQAGQTDRKITATAQWGPGRLGNRMQVPVVSATGPRQKVERRQKKRSQEAKKRANIC